MQKSLGMAILSEGDATLLNVYHVIELDPGKFPKVNAAGGTAFAEFMLSKEGQEAIRTFGVGKYGAPLFFPDGGKRED